MLQIPPIDSAIGPDLRTFIITLGHLPVELQIDVLRQATSQITEVLEHV